MLTPGLGVDPKMSCTSRSRRRSYLTVLSKAGAYFCLLGANPDRTPVDGGYIVR